ncbi:hypothetical protein [Brevundimonas sp.]|jgi:hypothetical protein|uniref:hypothetical protein n=1 Tax=Brevundimonas sp. TaxID=1871086 RepID=UPI002630BB02|nr:hypothetical protein [Brevundimonas sp.]
MRLPATLVTLASLIWALALSAPVRAQQGPYWSVSVGGATLSCRDHRNMAVPIWFDRNIGDAAIARRFPNGSMFIAFNPDAMQRMTPLVQVFVFAHECAHHALLPGHSESQADCWAASVVRRQGFVRTNAQLSEIMRQFAGNPGSGMGHLPGPQRANLIARCSMW